MVKDLPDFRIEAVGVGLEATSFRSGLDAAKPASPAKGDVWLATDTTILYVAFSAGSWTDIGALYLLLAGGTMSGAIAMGTEKITGLGDPTAAQDAATKTYVDDAAGLPNSASTPSRAIDTIYQNTTGNPILVSVVIFLDGATNERASIKIGSASPPTTVVGQARKVGGGVSQNTHTFLVPDNWFYEVLTVTSTPTISNWVEYP
ncbi:hypothetical protein LCGC14_0758370 [marine sediment metagenome]|uniref:Uncharacterized protein n=1 Tax=marine sediment metagenome TaxID=412755 RepID=A0A0F9Q205_9ZZZZ